MAANDPFTIFGDIGELASSKLEPKASFFSFVSWKEKLEENNLKTLRQLDITKNDLKFASILSSF